MATRGAAVVHRLERTVALSLKSIVTIVLMAAAALLSVSASCPGAEPSAKAGEAQAGSPAVAPEQLTRALADFNRGSALLEQYRYSEAAEAFEAVLKVSPHWTAARFNLGVAYLNMQKDASGSLGKARQAFEEVLRAEPGNLHAPYCLGLYYQYLGQNKEALAYFEKVHKTDPRDPHAAYKCAEVLNTLHENQEAIKMLEQVVALDPGFISAYYRLAMLYQQTQQREKAVPLLQRFQALNTNELAGGSFAVKQQAYGTVGKYGVLLESNRLPLGAAETSRRTRILFSPQVKELNARLKPWKWAGGSINLPGIAVGDLNGDGHLDLVLTAAGDDGATSVWINDGKGNFKQGAKIADKGVSPCLGDVNNDGSLDLWLGRAGQDLLFLGDGKGNFKQAPSPPTLVDPRITACARMFDLDGNALLDLASFRWSGGSLPADADVRPAPSMIYTTQQIEPNSFGVVKEAQSDLAPSLGLAMPQTPVSTVVYDDFDNDRDLDLILFPAKGKPIAWVNDRVGKYRLLDSAATGLDVEGVIGATSGDPYKTGNRDLLVFTGKEVRLYRNRGGFKFELDQEFARRFGTLGGTGGQFADMDNDGDLDILIGDAHRRDGTRGPALLVNDWPNRRFVDASELDPGNLLAGLQTKGDASCVAADFNGDGKLDLLLAEMNEPPRLIENLTQGGHYIAIDLLGKQERDRSARSSVSPIGTRVEIRSGTVSEQFVVGVPSGPIALPPLRIHAGLGPNTQVQWLRIRWPDAMLQSELELAADQTMKIPETNRVSSTCPHLYAWDGSRFALVADFGGVGGLGYWIAPDTFAMPRPLEYVPIPRLVPKDGQYVLQVLESLEETVYVDEAKLIAVDHPEGTEVWPNEMMAMGIPQPPFELFCFREPIEPVKAVDHRGVDVTEQLRRIDRACAGSSELENDLYGYAKDHAVELDFGDRLHKLPADARLVLVLYGSTEYPYSSTNYAASRAGLRMKAPSIEVWRGGRWVELLHEVGCPAGMQHVMAVDLGGKLLPSDEKIRVATNMEIYWDRIFLAAHRADARLRLQEVAAQSADVHFLGFARPYSPDGRRPELYDYERVDRAVPWHLMKGQYTRYGEVGELLRQTDDCYVIMGRGDELTLRFPEKALGPVPSGYRRSFLLKVDSYCKDMDLYTAHPDTVEPLPFHAMRSYPYGPDERYPETDRTKDYLRRYNTRRVQ